MDAKFCKYCGKEITHHEKERCIECFIKMDDGICYPPDWFKNRLP